MVDQITKLDHSMICKELVREIFDSSFGISRPGNWVQIFYSYSMSHPIGSFSMRLIQSSDSYCRTYNSMNPASYRRHPQEELELVNEEHYKPKRRISVPNQFRLSKLKLPYRWNLECNKYLQYIQTNHFDFSLKLIMCSKFESRGPTEIGIFGIRVVGKGSWKEREFEKF